MALPAVKLREPRKLSQTQRVMVQEHLTFNTLEQMHMWLLCDRRITAVNESHEIPNQSIRRVGIS